MASTFKLLDRIYYGFVLVDHGPFEYQLAYERGKDNTYCNQAADPGEETIEELKEDHCVSYCFIGCLDKCLGLVLPDLTEECFP